MAAWLLPGNIQGEKKSNDREDSKNQEQGQENLVGRPEDWMKPRLASATSTGMLLGPGKDGEVIAPEQRRNENAHVDFVVAATLLINDLLDGRQLSVREAGRSVRRIARLKMRQGSILHGTTGRISCALVIFRL